MAKMDMVVKGRCGACCGERAVRRVSDSSNEQLPDPMFYVLEPHMVGGDFGRLACRGSDVIPETIIISYHRA